MSFDIWGFGGPFLLRLPTQPFGYVLLFVYLISIGYFFVYFLKQRRDSNTFPRKISRNFLLILFISAPLATALFNIQLPLTGSPSQGQFTSSFQPTIKSYYASRYFGDVFDGIVQNLERRIVLEITDEEEALLNLPVSDPEILKTSEVFISGGGGIIEDDYYYEKDAKLAFIRPIPAEMIPLFDTAKDIEVVIERYFASLREGVNYPFLGLLTEGSQMMRLEYPESAHFYRSRWKDFEQGLPYEIKMEGDLAAAVFAEATSLPVFLRQTPEGYWKVDVARAWVSSWQDFAGNRWGPMHKDHPWMFAFPEYETSRSLCKVPGLRPLSVSMKDQIKQLEAAIQASPGDAANYFELADIFYWDCLWIAPAIDLVERGLELEPENVPYRWLAIYMHYRFPSPEANDAHYRMLLALDPENIDALYHYGWHCWHFSMDYRKAVRLLRKGREAEQKTTGDVRLYRRYIRDCQQNYWRQVAVDWNRAWAAFSYIRIFLLS